MPIVTLTTDFGELDYYVPLFKGEILATCPSVNLIDISNKIPPYDINLAAYIIKNSFEHYPGGTIHIIRVYEQASESQRILACNYRGQYFLAPDNGLLSLIMDESPTVMVAVDREQLKQNTVEGCYCRVIREIVYNGNIGQTGMVVKNIMEKRARLPVLLESGIRGTVAHIDTFGNIISNITKEDFDKTVLKKPYKVVLRRNEFIDELHLFYNDVPPGERLARFNSKGYLEIAINTGNASDLLGLHVGDVIQIELQ
jgi:S-adenosyl-L-methionine hydrolase (adenosine-forming)